MSNKLLSLLGLCRKAGMLAIGHDAAKEALRSKKAFLCLLASDVSDRLKKEAQTICTDIPVIYLDISMTELGAAIGKKAGMLAIKDQGFAQLITKETTKEGLI